MEERSDTTTLSLGSSGAKLHVVAPHLATHQKDDEGRELWWFGTGPPGGLPSPKKFIDTINQRRLREIPPPWSAVAKGIKDEGTWICTDPIGLNHIFLRQLNTDILVGADAIEIAACAPVHLDPQGAYDLFTFGNPQNARTLFSEIKCLAPSTLVKVCHPMEITEYWSLPGPSPVEPESATEIFTNALAQAVARHWREEDAQELTAGTDSMLLLAALVSQDIPVRTWTHGCRGDEDLLGAQERAARYNLHHQAVYLEPLLDIDPDEALALAAKFLRASSGMANILEFGYLPWILDRLNAKGSITGGVGEVFRGFYYQWIGKGLLPAPVGKWSLLRGKMRSDMPFGNPVLRKQIRKSGDRTIKNEFEDALSQGPDYWHSLDSIYLLHRMHHFGGTTFSATGRWHSVRVPFADPEVIDCLELIPIDLRRNSTIVREATRRLLKDVPADRPPVQSEKSIADRFGQLLNRIRERRGTDFQGFKNTLARKVLDSKEALSALDPDEMLTAGLYEPRLLKKTVAAARSGRPVPVMLGAVLTIELAAREVRDAFAGIDM